MKSIRTAAVTAAALALMAAPAVAQPPAGTPNGTSNPGAEHRPDGTPGAGARPDGAGQQGAANRPTRREARALGREQCREFRTNFRENRSAFGRCVAAVARALRSDVSPGRACRTQNRRREAGQRRSDFSACVRAAAHALREVEEQQAQETEGEQETAPTA